MRKPNKTNNPNYLEELEKYSSFLESEIRKNIAEKNNLIGSLECLVSGVKNLEGRIDIALKSLDESGYPFISCNFTKCAAGMGVAGNRNCFLGGDFRDKNCQQFEEDPTEDEILESLKEHKEKKLV